MTDAYESRRAGETTASTYTHRELQIIAKQEAKFFGTTLKDWSIRIHKSGRVCMVVYTAKAAYQVLL